LLEKAMVEGELAGARELETSAVSRILICFDMILHLLYILLCQRKRDFVLLKTLEGPSSAKWMENLVRNMEHLLNMFEEGEEDLQQTTSK